MPREQPRPTTRPGRDMSAYHLARGCTTGFQRRPTIMGRLRQGCKTSVRLPVVGQSRGSLLMPASRPPKAGGDGATLYPFLLQGAFAYPPRPSRLQMCYPTVLLFAKFLPQEDTPMENAPTSKGWRNPTVIAAIIGAVAAILVATIGLMPKTKPPEPTRIEQPTSGPGMSSANIPKVESYGGVAAGGDIQGNTITITSPIREPATGEKPKGN